MTLTWNTAAEWDGATSESGVVHESTANTDHNDATIVKQGYRAASPYLGANLVGYWPFHEDSGSTANDISGNLNDGTITGATVGQPGILGTTAYSFDGTGDYVDFGTGLIGTADSFTFSLWVKFNSFKADQRMFTLRSDVNCMLAQGRTGTDQVEFFVDGANKNLGTVTTGDWYHLAVTHDAANNDVNGYLDGSQGNATNADPNAASGSATAVGSDTALGANFLDGVVADVRLYNAELTAAEIQALYDVARTPGQLITAAKVN